MDGTIGKRWATYGDLCGKRQPADPQPSSAKNGDTAGNQLGFKRRQRGQQDIEVVTSNHKVRLTEEDEGWTFSVPNGKNRAEIGIRRHYNTILIESPGNNPLVFFGLHTVRTDVDRIMSRCQQEVGQLRR